MTTKHLRRPDVKVRQRESPTEGRYHHGRRKIPHPPTGAYKQKRDEKKTQTREELEELTLERSREKEGRSKHREACPGLQRGRGVQRTRMAAVRTSRARDRPCPRTPSGRATSPLPLTQSKDGDPLHASSSSSRSLFARSRRPSSSAVRLPHISYPTALRRFPLP